MERLLSRDGIKVAGELGVRLSSQAFLASQRCPRRGLMTGMKYSCGSTLKTWASSDLVAIDTTG